MRFASALQTYTGDTIVSNGTLDITGDFMPSGSGKGNLTVVSGGTFQLNNTSGNINGLSGNGTVAKTGSGGRILTLGNNNANGLFTGSFAQNQGTLTITKVGSGTQVIGGTLNNTGTINVNAGTLLFNGTHTAGVGNYTVGLGGTLGGTGLITFAATASLVVSNGGTLSPGNSAGLLRLSGGLGMTLQSNSTYAVELNGSGLGVGYDSVLVGAGTINISNSLLSVSLGYTPNVGDQFDIVTNATGNAVLGEFAGLGEGSIFNVSGTDLQITYLGGTGNDIVLTVVPEPSTLALIMFGLLGTCWIKRRSRR